MAIEPGLSEIVTTTGRLRSKVLKDNIRNNNAVFVGMQKYDGFREESGGRTIVEELFFDQNLTASWYFGGDAFSTAYNPVITAAEYDWKQLGGSVFITGRDQRMNSGPEAFIKLVGSRFKALELTLENQMNVGLLSDGTGSGGKQLIGLASLVSKTPTSGTVGGIARSSGGFFNNYKLQPTVDIVGASVTSAANIKQYYTRTIINTTRGVDKPTLIIAGATHYEALMTAMQSQQWITDPTLAKAGFENIVYQGIPVVLGGGVSYGGLSLVQTDLSYFLNTKYLKLVTHRDANFDMLQDVQSINQDAMVTLCVWMGALVLSNAKVQGVLFDS
jgi:hypothetical protein